MNECRIKYINKAKQELDVMKRNKLVLEHVIVSSYNSRKKE